MFDLNQPYTYHQDPGHGWIEVPMAELIALRIAGHISTYSYRRGDVAFLEEDCDASTWFDAYTQQHGEKPQLLAKHVENTPIRHYPRYHP